MVGLVFFLAISVSTWATEIAEFRLPAPILETLPNGMKVAWFLDDKLPVVDIALLIESGTKQDPKGKSGTVELVSRMLERGAKGLSAQIIGQKVESLGASGFASADEEGITVGMHGLSQDADALLEILSWMALSPNFSETEFNKEKIKIAESWKHLPDSVEALSGYGFGRAILSGTAYGRGSVKDVRELSKITVRDSESFYRTHFVAPNSVLMVVGRVDRAAFRGKIISLYGDWKGKKPKQTAVVYGDPKLSLGLSQKKSAEQREVLVIDRTGVPQAQIRLGFRIPGIHSEKRYSLAVANALLGEYFNSRLNLVVRDKLGLAYGIQSTLTYYKDLAFFSIGSATATQNTGKLIEETIRQLRLMKATDILDSEVQISKDYLLGGYPLSVSTLGAVASRWLNGYSFHLGPDYMNEFLPKVSAVTRESVVDAVEEAFHLDQMVIVVAGDAKEIEKSLRAKGFKKFRRISANSLL